MVLKHWSENIKIIMEKQIVPDSNHYHNGPLTTISNKTTYLHDFLHVMSLAGSHSQQQNGSVLKGFKYIGIKNMMVTREPDIKTLC